MPERIQRRRTKGWRAPEGAVYVGRGTKWGNPYTPDNYTIGWGPDSPRPATSAELVAAYRRELDCSDPRCSEPGWEEHPWTRDLDPRELRGKDLMCWCPLGRPCHADVLLDLANGGVR